jgi:hypothetical protein
MIDMRVGDERMADLEQISGGQRMGITQVKDYRPVFK